VPGCEILIAERTEDVVRYLREIGAQERAAIAAAARARVLSAHTAAERAAGFEHEVLAVEASRPRLAAGA
jgi:spore maturation protein CgeB